MSRKKTFPSQPSNKRTPPSLERLRSPEKPLPGAEETSKHQNQRGKRSQKARSKVCWPHSTISKRQTRRHAGAPNRSNRHCHLLQISLKHYRLHLIKARTPNHHILLTSLHRLGLVRSSTRHRESWGNTLTNHRAAQIPRIPSASLQPRDNSKCDVNH